MIRQFLLSGLPLADLYLGRRFFLYLGGVAFLSALGRWYAGLFWVAVVLLVVLLVLVGHGIGSLRRAAAAVSARRSLPRAFSLGDPMEVQLTVINRSGRLLRITVMDEWPAQLQLRDHRLELTVAAGSRAAVAYTVRPTVRGRFSFGAVNLFLHDARGLVEWRRRVPQEQEVPVYPSLVRMKRLAVQATPEAVRGRGRSLPVTRSYEFDQIKTYVAGDDRRSVNWKATARRGELMVNTYTTERAQRIYMLLDRGRTMLMPFDGLSLLDHAINASLALTNIVLQRGDRAGLLTFADTPGDFLPADNRPDQLRRTLHLLYRQAEHEGESDYDLLYQATRRYMPARSLLVLFANFESSYALDRALPVLRRLGRDHSPLVILFENAEIADLLREPPADATAVYRHGVARRYQQEREVMALRLRRNGVQVILTRPADLTGAVIQRYLELKDRGF